LRDPIFRDEMRELVKAAFTQTVEDLHEPAPAEPERRRP
jgi:hypothetical protein